MNQTVADDAVATDTPKRAEAAPQAEDTPDIEKLLEEFKQPAKAPEKKDDEDLRRQVQELRQDRIREVTQRGIQETVGALKKGLPEELKDFPDDLVEGFLHKRAADDSRIALAFTERLNNPSSWKKIQENLAKELSGKLGSLPTRNLVSDRKAALAASRGVSNTEPPEQPVDVNKMNASQLDAYIKTLPRR